MVAESLPIAKWLLAQRNANGGFSSTQVKLFSHVLFILIMSIPYSINKVSYYMLSIGLRSVVFAQGHIDLREVVLALGRKVNATGRWSIQLRANRACRRSISRQYQFS